METCIMYLTECQDMKPTLRSSCDRKVFLSKDTSPECHESCGRVKGEFVHMKAMLLETAYIHYRMLQIKIWWVEETKRHRKQQRVCLRGYYHCVRQ